MSFLPNMSYLLRPVHAGLPALAILGASLLHAAPVAAGDVFYSGRATAVNGQLKIGGLVQNFTVSDNGMSCQGTPKSETLYDVSHPLPLAVNASQAYTFTQGRNRSSLARARLSNVNVEVAGLKASLSAVDARSEARCDDSGTITLLGKSTLGSLTVNGQSYALTGQPNQSIAIPNVAVLIVNEQVKFSQEVRVTGLRIKLLDASVGVSGDVRIASTRAKISCE